LAKLRTGGVTPESIPSPAEVAEFIWDCARAPVPFKATAGLHHPVRAEHRLTYAPDGPRAVMHGFVNVFLAAAAAWRAVQSGEAAETPDPPAAVVGILMERDAAAFTIDGPSSLARHGTRGRRPPGARRAGPVVWSCCLSSPP
jgi:hypothetical protein